MLHKMKLNESPFNRIKNGTKTVEFRLFDEKRQQIKIGDKIEFSKLPDLQEKLLVDVIELYGNGDGSDFHFFLQMEMGTVLISIYFFK